MTHQTTYGIDEFHCSGDPTSAVQLSGGPILITIDCITVFRNTVDETDGELPYRSRFGSIFAKDSDFDTLENALVNGNAVKIKITYEKVGATEEEPATRKVRAIEIEISGAAVARLLSETLEVTKDIRAEVGADLGAVVMELKKTNALLQEHLPRRRSLSQRPQGTESIAADALDDEGEKISPH